MTNHKTKPIHPKLQRYCIAMKLEREKYNLHVPELCLFASHKDIDTALQILNEKATDIFAEYEIRGITNEIPEPTTKQTQRQKSATVSFAIKCMIFAIIFSFTAYLGSVLVTHKINQISIATVVKKQLKGASAILHSWSELDPQRKDSLLDDFEKQLHSIKPLIDRANNVFYPKIESEVGK